MKLEKDVVVIAGIIGAIIAGFLVGLFGGYLLYLKEESVIGLFAVTVGASILVTSCYYLFHGFQKIVEKQETSISVTALKTSSILTIGGLIIVILGLLYLMKVIPW